ncbi:MAG TPA: NAD+ synthetase, partial [Microscillaceae bacterium]|nr:NAD+ synthetase [Microscillaceae bacterium]
MPTQRIAGATLNQTPIQWETNFQLIQAAIQQAQNEKVAILCLPELCITGYGCEDLFLSQWIYDKALDYLLKIKPLCQNMIVVIGLPMRFHEQSYNCACVIANGEIVGITAKQFLALDGVHYEPRWFKAWKPEEVDFIEIEGKQYPFGDI